MGPGFDRRSLYRMWARGGRSPFLDTFDCPDPSTATPRRASTTTPLQALALWNNAFVLRMADRTDIVGSPADVASRVMSLAGPGQILLSSAAADEAHRFVTGKYLSYPDSARPMISPYAASGVSSCGTPALIPAIAVMPPP